jgi:hypothetical protein
MVMAYRISKHKIIGISLNENLKLQLKCSNAKLTPLAREHSMGIPDKEIIYLIFELLQEQEI